MQAPQFACVWRILPLAALFITLSLPALARAEPAVQRASSGERRATSLARSDAPSAQPNQLTPRTQPKQPTFEQDDEDESGEMTEPERLRTLALLATIMLRFGSNPPPDSPPPMIVKAPRKPNHNQPGDGGSGGGGGPTTSSISPEPGSVVTGLLGSGMVWVYSWMRKRRRREECRVDSNELQPEQVAA